MTVRKLTPAEKFFMLLVINAILFGGVIALNWVGLGLETILLILAAMTSLEVIYLAIVILMAVNRNTQRVEEVEESMISIREDEEKAHTFLIYLGHQMKTMQQELESLKKLRPAKLNGNGHQAKAHL